MANLRGFTLVAALVLSASLRAAPQANGGSTAAGNEPWTLVGTENGITIYKHDVSNSGIVALKGQGRVDAPAWKVASVLLDTNRASEWVDSLKESRVVRHLTSNTYVEYNHLHLPLILKDREFVSEVRIDVNASDRSVTLEYRPTDEPSVPSSGNVRGQIRSGAFRARSLGAGQGTELTAEIDCDPKGAIPAWVVNVFQKSWPRKTFEGVRKQVAKPDITMPAAFSELLRPAVNF